MQFIKTREVKSPVRVVDENAGIDCFVPDNCEDFVKAVSAKNAGIWIIDNTKNSLGWLIEKAGEHVNMFDEASGVFYIAPHKDIIIPSGIRSKFGPHLALIANNKSGIATKRKLTFGASVIDSGYQGEWHFHLINTSNEYQTVECGTKVIQFIPHLISTQEVEVLDLSPEEFYTEKTSRGDGWQGSTGLK